MLAKRLSQFDSSGIRAALAASANPNLIDLTIGYPSELTPDYIREAGLEAINQGYTHYAPGNGYPELRAAIAQKLRRDNHITVSADDVTVTPGLTTAIMLCYGALLNPGDEVLVADPYFPPYASLTAMVGATAVLVDTYPDFQLTAARIEPLITKRTKVLVINTPNNPTGAVYPEAELRAIANLAAAHDITIMSDEIYEPYTYRGQHFSIGSIYPNTLTLNGFSKSYAMTGWRIGYVAGPAPLIDAINAIQQYMLFSTSSIGQRAAMAALTRRPEDLYAAYREKHRLTIDALSNLAIPASDGAFYLFLPVPETMADLEFVQQCKQENVAILPGQIFSKRTTHVRLAFMAPPERLQTGLGVIKSVYASAGHEIK